MIDEDGDGPTPPEPTEVKPRRFYGRKTLDPVRLTRDASEIAEHMVAHLAQLTEAEVEVTVEVNAKIPEGAPPEVVRTVTENARTLDFDQHGFE